MYQKIIEYQNKYSLLLILSPIALFSFLFILFCNFSSDSVSIFPYSLTHTLERKYMFLICNGILAFLAGTSSSPDLSSGAGEAKISDATSPPQDYLADHHDRQLLKEDDQQVLISLPYKNDVALEEEEDLMTCKSTDVYEDDKNDVALEVEEEEESMSTEELNKKVEEFIRRMKEEIRIEAQQQLIAV